jgi:hypothetical protein
MRYLISKSNADEWQSRKQYIFEAMNLWTSTKECSDGFLEFTSIPSNCLDILFIVGHNYTVYNYINKNITLIKEKNIVAITCDGGMDFSSLDTSGKCLFICHQTMQNFLMVRNMILDLIQQNPNSYSIIVNLYLT